MADRRLQVFFTVAKQMSFTKAAEVLFMTQPAVTFQIKQLEEHFNTRLFERAHGGISLTPAGELVLQYAERILKLSAELDTRMGELTGQVTGQLLIGASATIAEFMLPRLLGEFRVLYPNVQARLTVSNSESVEIRVAEHTLDIGLIEAPSHLPSLHTEVCGQDELVVICTPGHALAELPNAPPRQLTAHPYVARESGSGTREMVDAYFRKAGIQPEDLECVMEVGSPEALKGVVSTGLGFGVVSKTTVRKELLLKELVSLPLQPRLVRELSLVYPREKFRSRLVNTFIEFARDRMRQSPQ